jgi:hypothetical protein
MHFGSHVRWSLIWATVSDVKYNPPERYPTSITWDRVKAELSSISANPTRLRYGDNEWQIAGGPISGEHCSNNDLRAKQL